jgi:Tfp pilus assembly protein PilV
MQNQERSYQPGSRAGFTVVEVVVAIMVLVGGMLVMASIMGSTAQLQRLSSSRAEITTLAEAKIEELRAYGMAASTDPLRQKVALGGSVTGNVTGYRDTVLNVRGKKYTRAWAITEDVAKTRRVTVRVRPMVDTKNDIKRADFSTLIWLQ